MIGGFALTLFGALRLRIRLCCVPCSTTVLGMVLRIREKDDRMTMVAYDAVLSTTESLTQQLTELTSIPTPPSREVCS